jgi:D-arabinose 1-dehydrogenase-like Zn-dependent alcohol dehydrogenase
VFVRMPADSRIELTIIEIVANNIKIIGSTLGNRVDLPKTFELHTTGKTRVITGVRKLEQVNESFEEVETGKAKARLVFDFRRNRRTIPFDALRCACLPLMFMQWPTSWTTRQTVTA